jgi:hypothetical protein
MMDWSDAGVFGPKMTIIVGNTHLQQRQVPNPRGMLRERLKEGKKTEGNPLEFPFCERRNVL